MVGLLLMPSGAAGGAVAVLKAPYLGGSSRGGLVTYGSSGCDRSRSIVPPSWNNSTGRGVAGVRGFAWVCLGQQGTNATFSTATPYGWLWIRVPIKVPNSGLRRITTMWSIMGQPTELLSNHPCRPSPKATSWSCSQSAWVEGDLLVYLRDLTNGSDFGACGPWYGSCWSYSYTNDSSASYSNGVWSNSTYAFGSGLPGGLMNFTIQGHLNSRHSYELVAYLETEAAASVALTHALLRGTVEAQVNFATLGHYVVLRAIVVH